METRDTQRSPEPRNSSLGWPSSHIAGIEVVLGVVEAVEKVGRERHEGIQAHHAERATAPLEVCLDRAQGFAANKTWVEDTRAVENRHVGRGIPAGRSAHIVGRTALGREGEAAKAVGCRRSQHHQPGAGGIAIHAAIIGVGRCTHRCFPENKFLQPSIVGAILLCKQDFGHFPYRKYYDSRSPLYRRILHRRPAG